MLPPKLDYLFIAEFRDGTIYRQTPADTSIVHPLTKSAFFDVLQRMSELVRFTLTDGRREHTVFLDDGHFKTDGNILTHGYGELTNYRLVYFRRMRVESRDGVHGRPEVALYFIGWQANDSTGKNYQMGLQIDPSGSLKQPAIKRKHLP